MGYFAPTFLALILNVLGIYIFATPPPAGCEPLVSCLIFLVAIFLLLLEIDLSIFGFRNLWTWGAYIMQFFLACFAFEFVMCFFWFPLELSTASGLVKVADLEQQKLRGDLHFLSSPLAHVIISYMISIFFLIAVLHSTKYIDLRLMGCGIGTFLGDIRSRIIKFFRSFKKRFSFHSISSTEDFCNCKQRVQFSNNHSKKRGKSRRSNDDDDYYDDEY